jgi:hypothetical protein
MRAAGPHGDWLLFAGATVKVPGTEIEGVNSVAVSTYVVTVETTLRAVDATACAPLTTADAVLETTSDTLLTTDYVGISPGLDQLNVEWHSQLRSFLRCRQCWKKKIVCESRHYFLQNWCHYLSSRT